MKYTLKKSTFIYSFLYNKSSRNKLECKIMKKLNQVGLNEEAELLKKC